MKTLSRSGLALFLLSLAAFPSLAVAQSAPVEISETQLISLYKALLNVDGKPDPYLEKRIVDERSRIRSQIDDDLNQYLNERTNEEKESASLTDALERQRITVSTLEERKRDREVDLDLLMEEEKKFYVDPAADIEASEDEYRLTETHPELLAKKAILEEHIAALNFFLQPQQERLNRLSFQKRMEQFAGFINIAKYVGILVVIFFIERLVRLRVFTIIQNRSRRYALMKIFTMIVYISVAFWLISRLFSEHPGILTSFAIVGAGLAVALQDVVKDFIGWLVIVQGRRFSLGQRITVGNVTGDVIDIGLLRTTLLEVNTGPGNVDLERTGRTMYLPNSTILTNTLLNYNTTSDFIKAEMDTVITYESDWKEAQKILMEILKEENQEFAEKAQRQSLTRTQQFYFSHEMRAPIVYIDSVANGIRLAMRFYVPIGERRLVVTKITEKMLERFAAAKPSIELAYNTTRVYSTALTE